MEAIKRLFEKKVDERQEMELLKAEHYSFWFMYWALFAAMIIQGIVMEDARMAAGEWIVFMATCIVLIVSCVRKGVWSFQSRKVPGAKSWFLYSLFLAIGAGIPFGLLFGMKWNPGNVKGIALFVVVMMVVFFVMSIVAFSIVGSLTKSREKKLAEIECEEEDEE